MDELLTKRAMEFAEGIPMNELFDELKKVTGLSDLKFTYKIKEDRHGMPSISFESQDLVDKVGFLRLIFSEIRVSNFNSEVVYRNDEFIYWCTVSFQYNHNDGGSNGKTFYTARYKNGYWEYELR